MKIISGGQTGVDRSALDAAIDANIDHGGWCPKGRKAEDGRISELYHLTETPSHEYEIRTEWNVRDSEATLIITKGEPTGGTALTIAIAKQMKKPCLMIDLYKYSETQAVRTILDWMTNLKIQLLNVAGPRESNISGIYNDAKKILLKTLSKMKNKNLRI